MTLRMPRSSSYLTFYAWENWKYRCSLTAPAIRKKTMVNMNRRSTDCSIVTTVRFFARRFPQWDILNFFSFEYQPDLLCENFSLYTGFDQDLNDPKPTNASVPSKNIRKTPDGWQTRSVCISSYGDADYSSQFHTLHDWLLDKIVSLRRLIESKPQ